MPQDADLAQGTAIPHFNSKMPGYGEKTAKTFVKKM
jgi:hypothetical protein